MFYNQSHGYISLHSKLASLGAMNDINIVPIHFFCYWVQKKRTVEMQVHPKHARLRIFIQENKIDLGIDFTGIECLDRYLHAAYENI